MGGVYMGNVRSMYKIFVGNPERRGQSEDQRLILKWRNIVGGCGLISSGWGWGLPVDFCKHYNEPLGFVKDGKFLDQLSAKWASQEGLCTVMEIVTRFYMIFFQTLVAYHCHVCDITFVVCNNYDQFTGGHLWTPERNLSYARTAFYLQKLEANHVRWYLSI